MTYQERMAEVLQSITTDAAYIRQQLNLCCVMAHYDCVIRALDALNRIEEACKMQKEDPT